MGKLNESARNARDISGERNPSYVHGHNQRGARSTEYEIWAGIKQRTSNPKSKLYPYYGGRGIKMCARWRASFSEFLKDVGPRPSKRHSIDRENNNGHYEPGNVRWATRKEQAQNRRNAIKVSDNGREMCLREYCDLKGVPYKRVWRRLRDGWPLSDAVNTPARGGNHG